MAKGKTQIPDDFIVTEEMTYWARVNVPGLDVDTITKEFIDYSHARDWRMADWVATWRNWMRKAHKSSAGRSVYSAPAKAVEARPKPKVEEIFPQRCRWQAASNRILFAVLQAAAPVPVDRLDKLVAMKVQMGKRLANLYGGSDCPQDEWRKISQDGFKWLERAARGISGRAGAEAEGAGASEREAA